MSIKVRSMCNKFACVSLIGLAWMLVAPIHGPYAYASQRKNVTLKKHKSTTLKKEEQRSISEPATEQKANASAVVNINSASAAELSTLPGIGPSKADRIVRHRKKHGPFKRTKDLRRVKGIGYKTWKRLEPMIAVK